MHVVDANSGRFLRRLTTLAGACALGILVASCASTPTSNTAKTFTQSSLTQHNNAAGIRTLANRVADWQLAHMELEDFAPYITSFQERSTEKRGWIQGTFFKGLADWSVATDNASYTAWLHNFAAEQGYQLGDRIYHADDHVVGQYYLTLLDEAPEQHAILAPTQAVLDQVLAAPSDVSLRFEPKGTEKGYYKQCIKRWCWSDALFMSPPVWTKLTKLTGDPRYLAFSNQEFWLTTNYLFDQEAGLYFRDSRFFNRTETNGAKIYWSRGNGWVFAGLTDIIDDLPLDHPDRHKYVSLYRTMATSLAQLQSDNGYWPVSLTAGELYPAKESSGTAFFVAGFAWGVANGTLDDETYLPIIRRGWQAIASAVNADGMLGRVQQVGSAPAEVVEAETQFYGTGALLLAATAMLQLHEQGVLPE